MNRKKYLKTALIFAAFIIIIAGVGISIKLSNINKKTPVNTTADTEQSSFVTNEEPESESRDEETLTDASSEFIEDYSFEKTTLKDEKDVSSKKTESDSTTAKKGGKEGVKESTTKRNKDKDNKKESNTTTQTPTTSFSGSFNPFEVKTDYEPGVNQNDKEYLDAVKPYMLCQSKYPSYARHPYSGMENLEGKDVNELFEKWREDAKKREKYYNKWGPMESFLNKSINEFMTEKDGENSVFSPANIYFALCVISETAGGNTRTQIMNLLGENSLKSLRSTANAVWNASFCDDGARECVLANSIWLNNKNTYNSNTLKNISKYYYASSFSGEMGSDGYNKAYRQWLNTQTGGLLKNQVNSLKLPAETDFAVASTVYFKTRWAKKFEKSATYKDVFHKKNGDVKVDFMHRRGSQDDFYQGEYFSAVNLRLEGGGGVVFILPDKGVTPEQLYKNSETMSFILLSDLSKWENQTKTDINYSVPKFDVQSKLDLIKGLKKMGVTDCFDSSVSDFTPITALKDEISEMVHGARAKIDEEGIEAAAYTSTLVTSSAVMPQDEIDFTLDRPFIFVVKGVDGLPLFVGTVNNP